MATERQMLEGYERKGDINPVQKTRLAELRQAGAAGSPAGIPSPTGSYLAPAPGAMGGMAGVGGPTMQNFGGMVSQAQKMYQEAAAPQVQALEAQKPEIETRYQDLLADITKTGRAAKTEEFARRGIPISSGMLEHQLGQQLAGPIAQAGQARGAEMSNLASVIANLQGGGMTGGIQTALSLMGMQTGAQQSAAQLALQQRQLEQSAQQAGQQAGFAQEQFEWQKPYQESLWEKEIAKPYYKPTEGGGDDFWEDMMSLLVPGAQAAGPTEAAPLYTPSGGVGGFSREGEWYFEGNNWIPVVA